eukprot:6131042-Amphidinium_carterae.1
MSDGPVMDTVDTDVLQGDVGLRLPHASVSLGCQGRPGCLELCHTHWAWAEVVICSHAGETHARMERQCQGCPEEAKMANRRPPQLIGGRWGS